MRTAWIDNIKAFLIFLVVLGHVIQFWPNNNWCENRLFLIIYSFHMPLFIFISGYVSSKYMNNINLYHLLQKRTIQLLIPYVSWSIIQRLLHSDTSFIDFIIRPECGLWFLYVLFFITVIHKITLYIEKNTSIHRYLIYAIVIIIGHLISHILNGTFGSALYSKHIIYYIIGYELARTNKSIPIQYGFFCLLLWILMAYKWEWAGFNHFISLELIKKIGDRALYFIMSISGCIGFISLFEKNNQKITNKYLLIVGRSTLGIYAIHYLLIDCIITHLTIQLNYSFVFLLTIIITILSTLLVSALKLNRYTKLLLLGIINNKLKQ